MLKQILSRFAFLIAFGASPVVAAPVNSAAPMHAWPMYQYFANHNATFHKHDFSVSWSYDARSQINGGLALVDNTLYFGTFAGKVVALDATRGTEQWSADTADMTMSTPIISHSVLVIGTGHNGKLAHHSAGSYAYEAGATTDQTWGRPEGDDVLALDASSGKKLWLFHTKGEDMPSAAYTDGSVIFANGDLHAYSLDIDNGKARWDRALAGVDTMSSAAIDAHNVFVSTCHDTPFLSCNTVALDTRSGRVLWESPFGNSDCSPAVEDGRVYVSGIVDVPNRYEHGGYTVTAALDAKTGQALWTYTSEPGPYTSIGSSERAIAGTVADGLYFQPITTTGQVVALDASTGALKWKFSAIAPVKMSPVVRPDGTIYFGDTAGILYTLDAKSGALIYTRTFSHPFSTSPPIIVGDTLFVANSSMIYALSLPNIARPSAGKI